MLTPLIDQKQLDLPGGATVERIDLTPSDTPGADPAGFDLMRLVLRDVLVPERYIVVKAIDVLFVYPLHQEAIEALQGSTIHHIQAAKVGPTWRIFSQDNADPIELRFYENATSVTIYEGALKAHHVFN